MRCKREFPIDKIEAQKKFAASLKTLQTTLANIDPTENPLKSHQIHQAIFALPNAAAFGDEEHMGNLHFNDHLNLKELAYQADDSFTQTSRYLQQALQQLDIASDCYQRSKCMSAAKKEQYQINISACKSNIEASLKDEQDHVQDSPEPISKKQKTNTTFYAASVPPKKKDKFERDELCVLKPLYKTPPPRPLSFFLEKSHAQKLIEEHVSSAFKNSPF